MFMVALPGLPAWRQTGLPCRQTGNLDLRFRKPNQLQSLPTNRRQAFIVAPPGLPALSADSEPGSKV